MTGRQSFLLYSVPMEKPPEVLAQTARDILRDAGYTDPPADSASSFITTATRYQDYVEKNDRSPKRFEKMPALAMQFWYRQSPLLLMHTGIGSGVSLAEPPFTNEGESVVWLDSRGRLTGLRVIPKAHRQSGPVQTPDWSALFKASGLDPAKYSPVEPESIPPMHADSQAAWTGMLPDLPGTAIRIEAAAWQGKPVAWRFVVPSWNNFSTATLPLGQIQPGTGGVTSLVVGIAIVLLFIAGPAFFARRNLRMGRGDRSGAARLAFFIVGLLGVAWIFGEHHVANIGEFILFIASAAYWLLVAGWLWLMYIALEPYARRRWPGTLVSWSRLLAGNYRDPLVGRDLLVGYMAFAAFNLCVGLGMLLARHWLGTPQPVLFAIGTTLLSGSHMIVAEGLRLLVTSIVVSLAAAFLVFMLRALFRSTWAAAGIPTLIALLLFLGTMPIGESIFFTLLIGGLFIVFLRFGLLALVSYSSVMVFSITFPIAAPLSAWYSGIGLTGLALLLALAIYAFHTSLGGQPMFGRASMED